MEGPVKERWQELCEQAANENDPARLLELVQEIDRIFEDKQRRLQQAGKPEETEPRLKAKRANS